MADDDFRKRRRQREKELDQELGENPNFEAEQAQHDDLSFASKRVDDMIHRIEPMIDQVNNLYNQFASGMEQRPPLERQKYLEGQLAILMSINKPSPQHRFRATSIQTTYIVFKDRWDRLMKDIESGKHKRVVRAGRRNSG